MVQRYVMNENIIIIITTIFNIRMCILKRTLKLHLKILAAFAEKTSLINSLIKCCGQGCIMFAYIHTLDIEHPHVLYILCPCHNFWPDSSRILFSPQTIGDDFNVVYLHYHQFPHILHPFVRSKWSVPFSSRDNNSLWNFHLRCMFCANSSRWCNCASSGTLNVASRFASIADLEKALGLEVCTNLRFSQAKEFWFVLGI